ncbi:MAG TPA: hypothetical protein PKD91_01945 [Bacteroidia bacterium]|nr:hypothetical protein [Bacteroidia bacterium]
MEKVPTLPAEVEKDYTCVKVIPGEVVWRNRTIDLTKIDKATAEELVKEKFPYLVKKSPAASAQGSASKAQL